MGIIRDINNLFTFHPEEQIVELCRDLRKICASTEDEFFNLGSRLQSYASATSDLSGNCDALLNSLTDQALGSSMDQKKEQLEQLKLYVSEIDIDYDWIQEVLGYLLKSIGEVRSPLRQMRSRVIMLRNMGVSAKACIAELGARGHDFVNLTDVLQQISESVSERTNTILEGIDPLQKITEDACQMLGCVRNGAYEQLLEATKLYVDLIHDFRETSLEFKTVSSELTQGFEDTTSSIMEIVVALQAHDILRQNLEHVAEALEGLCTESVDHRRRLIPLRNYEHIVEVCKLQTRQVKNAHARFKSALSSVSDSLDNMVGHSRNALDRSIILEKILERFQALSSSLSERSLLIDQYVDSNRTLLELLATVRGNVENICDTIDFIKSIDRRMHRIGLNAAIRAVHIGDGGESLVVLSGAIRECASEISGSGRQASDRLFELVERFQILNESRDDKTQIICELRDTLATEPATYHAMEGELDRIVGNLHHVESFPDELVKGKEIVTCQYVSLQTMVDHALGRLEQITQQAAELQHRFSLKYHRRESGERMNSLKNKYTMQSEHQVHESVENTDDVMGEGIELFGVESGSGGDDEVELWDGLNFCCDSGAGCNIAAEENDEDDDEDDDENVVLF